MTERNIQDQSRHRMICMWWIGYNCVDVHSCQDLRGRCYEQSFIKEVQSDTRLRVIWKKNETNMTCNMTCYEMRVIVMTWGESSHPLVGLQCDDSWQCMFVVNDMRRITTSWWWFMTLYVCSKWTRCDRMLRAIIDEMREALPPMFSREPEDRAVRTLHTQYTVHW